MGLINFLKEGRISVYKLKYPEIKFRKGKSDRYEFNQVYVYKDYDINLKNPKIIIDAGACIGISTRFLAKKYPNAKVIALEPDKNNFKLLKFHTRDCKNVIALNKALWKDTSKLKITNPNGESMGFIVNKSQYGEVQGVSISNLIKEFQIKKIDFFKIDIEGSEKEIFENSNEWISKVGVVQIEIHEQIKKGSTLAVFDALKNFNSYRKGECDIFYKEICNN